MKEIKSVWNEIEYAFSNRMGNYPKRLLKLTLSESKDHDNFRSDDIQRGITIHEESKLFACQRLTSYLYDLSNAPSVENFINSQVSVFFAYSMAKSHKEDLKKRISRETAENLQKYDYCKLI
jgi:hypothetical protein